MASTEHRDTAHATRYLTVDETAERTHAGVSSVRQWIRTGRLSAYRPGRRVLIPEAEVMELIRSHRVGGFVR